MDLIVEEPWQTYAREVLNFGAEKVIACAGIAVAGCYYAWHVIARLRDQYMIRQLNRIRWSGQEN